MTPFAVPYRKAAAWLLVAAGLAAAGGCAPSAADRGRQLFNGELPLDGRISGHETSLPTLASRCSNCHSPVPAGSSSTQAFGITLTREQLVDPIARRGGPPSRFDEASLCKLLRTGIDPASVIVPSAMPRYRIEDADCHALWEHLTRKP